MINELLLLLFFSATLSFGDGNAIETPEWSYEFKEENFIPGSSANQISIGIPVGRFELKKSPFSLNGLKLTEFFPQVNQLKKVQNLAVENEKNRILEEVKNTTLAKPISAEIKPISSNGVVGNAIGEPFLDWGLFKECALRSLPVLRKLMKVKLQTPEAYWLENEFIETLKKERNGVVCGKYLGKNKIQIPSLLEEVKFLAAFLSRKPPELQYLARVVFMAYQSDSNGELTLIWKKYWSLLSVLAVFSEKPLPELEELGKKIKEQLSLNLSEDLKIKTEDLKINTENLKIKINLLDLKEKTREGLKLTEGMFP